MSANGEMVRVVILADVRIYRDGVAGLLRGRDGFCVLDPRLARIDDVVSLRPDMAIVDLSVAACRAAAAVLRHRLPTLRLVAIGVGDSEDEVISVAESGVSAYVSRDATAEQFLQVVEGAARDEVICPPRIAGALFRRLASVATQRDRTDMLLTIREREVLALIREDLGNKQIAERLQIAEATVKNHVHSLLEKLHVKRRAQAAKMSLESRPATIVTTERRRGST
jgi:DNA-binding NarL/FixJ family response regulator